MSLKSLLYKFFPWKYVRGSKPKSESITPNSFAPTSKFDPEVDSRPVICPFCGEVPDMFADSADRTVHICCPTSYCGNSHEVVAEDRLSAIRGWYDTCKELSAKYGIAFPRKAVP